MDFQQNLFYCLMESVLAAGWWELLTSYLRMSDYRIKACGCPSWPAVLKINPVTSNIQSQQWQMTCLFSFYLLYAHFYYWILMARNSTVFRVTSQEKPQTRVDLFLAVIQGTVELHLSSMLQNINVRGVSLMCCAVESSRSRPPWPAAPEPRLVFLQTGNTTGTHHTLYWTGNISTTLIIMLHNTTVSRNCRDVYNYLFSAWMLARCIHLLARCLWNEVLCWS